MPCRTVDTRTGSLLEFQDAWASVVRMEASPIGEARPRLAVRACTVPGLSLGVFVGSPARIRRTKALARDCQDDVIICIERRAALRVESAHGGARDFLAGEAHVWHADVPMTCDVGGAFSALMIALPGALARAAEGFDSVLRAGGIPAATPELRLLSAYARTALDEMPVMRAEMQGLCVSHLQDLALAAFAAAGGAMTARQPSGVRTARLAAIKADIRAHLGEAGLSVDWITRRHRISARYLRDLFADEGTSFTGYVTDQRLVHTHRRLADPRLAHRTVAEIAYEAGFGDISWFNRAFRRRFGMTPSDARAAASGTSRAGT
ncbi:helix-turn-helix transcriptional regulator [Pseudogemmobacter sonorensis]|uniref:helix-turn-helix transcriptional regulator n=1 Tax=Pseudogemmobacter sonorensis TaxID=2989681 RepID=UPI003677EE66